MSLQSFVGFLPTERSTVLVNDQNLGEVLGLTQERYKIKRKRQAYEDPASYMNAKEEALEKLEEEAVALYKKYISEDKRSPIEGIRDPQWRDMPQEERKKLVLRYIQYEIAAKKQMLESMYPESFKKTANKLLDSPMAPLAMALKGSKKVKLSEEES